MESWHCKQIFGPFHSHTANLFKKSIQETKKNTLWYIKIPAVYLIYFLLAGMISFQFFHFYTSSCARFFRLKWKKQKKNFKSAVFSTQTTDTRSSLMMTWPSTPGLVATFGLESHSMTSPLSSPWPTFFYPDDFFATWCSYVTARLRARGVGNDYRKFCVLWLQEQTLEKLLH